MTYYSAHWSKLSAGLRPTLIPDNDGGEHNSEQRYVEMKFPREGDAFGDVAGLIEAALREDNELVAQRNAMVKPMAVEVKEMYRKEGRLRFRADELTTDTGDKKTGNSEAKSGGLTWRDAVHALSDSLSHTQQSTALWTRSQSDDAKIQKISERLKKLEADIPSYGMAANDFNTVLSTALKGSHETYRVSTYKKVEIDDTSTTIRIGNHYATVTNFKTSNNAGVVIKTHNKNFRPDDSVDYLEFVYFGDKLSGDTKLQRSITKGLRHYVETGSFEQMPKPDILNSSGRYRDIMKSMGLDSKLLGLVPRDIVEVAREAAEAEQERKNKAAQFRIEDDAEILAWLNSLGPDDFVKVYRNVQILPDGSMASVMAKYDENGNVRRLYPDTWNGPENMNLDFIDDKALDERDKLTAAEPIYKIDSKGKRKAKEQTYVIKKNQFRWCKTTGKAKLQYCLKRDGDTVWADYNPYDHAVLVPLNDQFKAAWKRPNLVVVEALMPKKELLEGFKAAYAAKATGGYTWNNGRNLYLSRWSKIIRIVPNSEVAGMIHDYWKRNPDAYEGTKVTDYDRFTPQIREELEKLGWEFRYNDSKNSNLSDEEREKAYRSEGAIYLREEDIESLNGKFTGEWVNEPIQVGFNVQEDPDDPDGGGSGKKTKKKKGTSKKRTSVPAVPRDIFEVARESAERMVNTGAGGTSFRVDESPAARQMADGRQIESSASEPTEGQKEAGNYRKGHVRVDGHAISIENEAGSVRRGRDADGKEWATEMKFDYGYIRGTEGVDGDHIDVFLSGTPERGDVYVVDQVNKDGSFDEHKVMYGFGSEGEARAAYLSNYEEGWQGLGNITRVTREEFKKWVRSSKRKTKPFAEYKGVTLFRYDQQGNAIDNDGNLIVDVLNSIDSLTDADFMNPSRSVQLPQLPNVVQNALSSNGKPVVIKKNIFERNLRRHPEVTPEKGRNILREALYNPDIYGQNQRLSRPNNWIVIKLPDEGENNRLVVLEVNEGKKNVEIVHWYAVNQRGLEKIKRQAIDEDGQLLILPSDISEEAGTLSSLIDSEPSDSEVNTSFSDIQTNVGESSDAESISGGLDMGEESDVDIAREAVGTHRGARTQFRITGVPAVAAAAVYESRVRTAGYQVQEAFQDSMLGLRAAYEAIENGSRFSSKPRKIEDIPDAQNAYLFENRMSSLNQEEQRLRMNNLLMRIEY